MIISPGRKFIFVHIPKTGGTSMAAALEQRAMADDILIGDTPKAKRRRNRLKQLSAKGRLWKHSTLADIDGVVNSADLERYFIFTLVRNPWDRLVSYYAWLRAQSFEHPAVALAKKVILPPSCAIRQRKPAFARDHLPAICTMLKALSAPIYLSGWSISMRM